VSTWRRRDLIKLAGGLAIANTQPGARSVDAAQASRPAQRSASALALTDFEPRSMLHVPETRVEKPRFPVIDVHSHLTFSDADEGIKPRGIARELLPVMDQCGVSAMVNLTGGRGKALVDTVARYDQAHPGRFFTYTEPWWRRIADPGYAKFQADQIDAAHKAGARGVKVTKALGLYLRERGKEGRLIKVDDPRFDPMWEACGALRMPVAIHVSDPEAFFLPIDRHNERYEELYHHPDWSFHGGDFPSHAELLAACDRVFARHSRTTFIALHVGHNAENLARVAERLERHPNMVIDLGARIGELGRQPRTARKFFDTYQDRILFGTDATPHGVQYPQQLFGDALYRIYYRFLETEDEYFDYAPAATPPQGRWRIYGLGLPDAILKKVYYENATRWLKIPLP